MLRVAPGKRCQRAAITGVIDPYFRPRETVPAGDPDCQDRPFGRQTNACYFTLNVNGEIFASLTAPNCPHPHSMTAAGDGNRCSIGGHCYVQKPLLSSVYTPN